MQRLDVLAHEDGTRLLPLTGATLDRREDAPLQHLVREAARVLNAGMSCVSLVLRRVVFFRAQHGLPEQLARARGVERDTSLCQLVVHSAEAFESADTSVDGRVPRAAVDDLGVRAYRGEPLTLGGCVVGSLAVFDSAPREFSEEQRHLHARLAAQVSARLEELATPNVPTAMLVKGVRPLFGELRNVLAPLKSNTAEARVTADELAPLLSGQAVGLLHELRELLADMEAGVERLTGGLLGLERIFVHSSSGASAFEVVDAATLLVAHITRSAGGVRWSDVPVNVRVGVPVGVGASALSMCLSALAERSARAERGGVDAAIVAAQDEVRFELSAPGVSVDVAPLRNALGNVPRVSLAARGDVVVLTIARDHEAERARS